MIKNTPPYAKNYNSPKSEVVAIFPRHIIAASNWNDASISVDDGTGYNDLYEGEL